MTSELSGPPLALCGMRLHLTPGAMVDRCARTGGARHGAATEPRSPRTEPREAGITLVEMMVALVILAVILGAVAASLIAFSRAAIAAERRVQATALLNQLHEEFQAAPWESVGTDLDEFDGLRLTENPLETGDPLKDRLGVGTDYTDHRTYTGDDGDVQEVVLTDSDEDVVEAYSLTTMDVRDYEVFQFVTWVDRTGDTEPDVKRLTAVVRWEILSRSYEQVFVSERAPSVQESGDFGRPRLIQFDLFPTAFELAETTLGEDGQLYTDTVDEDDTVRIAVRFSSAVRDVRLEFDRILSVDDGFAELEVVEVDFPDAIIGLGGTGTYFVLDEVELADYRFTWGPRPLRIYATPDAVGAEEFQAGSRNIRFFCDQDPEVDSPSACGDNPDDDNAALPAEDPPPTNGGGGGGSGEVEVGVITVLPLAVKVYPQGQGGNYRLCNPVTVTAPLGGYLAGDSVALSWFDPYNDQAQSATMTVTGSTATYTFGTANQRRLRNPVGEAEPLVEFTVQVFRNGFIEGEGVSPSLTVTGVNSC